MYEKNTGKASSFAPLSGRCLLCPVCRAAGVGRCGAFAPRGPKPPPAEVRRWGVLRRLRSADTVQPIFASEFFPKNRFLLSFIFFLPCFCLDPKAPKDQARRKGAGAATRAR